VNSHGNEIKGRRLDNSNARKQIEENYVVKRLLYHS
jgi:hypothetical protein